jgi:hypothetical protein
MDQGPAVSVETAFDLASSISKRAELHVGAHWNQLYVRLLLYQLFGSESRLMTVSLLLPAPFAHLRCRRPHPGRIECRQSPPTSPGY